MKPTSCHRRISGARSAARRVGPGGSDHHVPGRPARARGAIDSTSPGAGMAFMFFLLFFLGGGTPLLVLFFFILFYFFCVFFSRSQIGVCCFVFAAGAPSLWCKETNRSTTEFGVIAPMLRHTHIQS